MKMLKLGDPALAIGYLRASRDEQQQKLSPEAQRGEIEAWAKREKVRVVAWHTDRLRSVTDIDDRPGLVAALGELRPMNAGVLVVARRDRIARDVIIAAMLERQVHARGAQVVSASGEGNGDSPADQFLRRVVDAAAEYERGLIRSRTRAALAAKRARGERAGEVPFGYEVAPDGVTLQPCAAEQQVIELVRRRHATGDSPADIARRLAEAGHCNRACKPYHRAQVHRILRLLDANVDRTAA